MAIILSPNGDARPSMAMATKGRMEDFILLMAFELVALKPG